MKSLDEVVRKIFRSSVTVSDTGFLGTQTVKSSKSDLRTISEIASDSHSQFSRSCFRSNNCSNKISNILKIYFDFAYYIGCSPFHFAPDLKGDFEERSWYRIKTWKPQQAFCALLHCIGMLRLFTEIRIGMISQMTLQSPENYFAITGGALRILFKFVTIKRFWCNQKQFLEILNFITVEKRLPDCHLKMQNKYLICILCGLCFLMPVMIAFKNDIVVLSAAGNSTWWNRRLATDGRFAFFIVERSDNNPNYTATNIIPDAMESPILDYFFGLLMGTGLLERLIMGFYFDISLLCGVVTLWAASYAFSGTLKKDFVTSDNYAWANLSLSRQKSPKESIFGGDVSDKSEKWLKLYESYKAIRTLSQLINNAFGSMITMFVAESILYHSMNMDAVILTRDVWRQAYIIFFIVSSSLTFLYAADICNQMDNLKNWLANDENRRSIPLDELNIVLHELQTNAIGIRGSNIFTITYSLVWNMITTVVTYFIICMQARGNSNHQ